MLFPIDASWVWGENGSHLLGSQKQIPVQDAVP